MLNLSLLLTQLLINPPFQAFSTPLDNQTKVIRQLNCEGSYAPHAADHMLPMVATMTDFSFVRNDQNFEEYISSIDLNARFVAPEAKLAWSEVRPGDVETDRDDDPNGRRGWGGKMFYVSLLKGTPENPEEAFAFLTSAVQSQMGAALRQYHFAAIQIKKSEVDENETVQTPLGQGTMICKVR